MRRRVYIILIFFGCFIASLFALQGCQKAYFDAELSNAPENITTLKMEFTDITTGEQLNYYFRDINKDDTMIVDNLDAIRLKAYHTYNSSIKLYKKYSSDSISDITPEIKNEGRNHIVCMESSTHSFIIRTDDDGHYPIGLESKWMNGAGSSGYINISLMHQPGLKNGSCQLGESDLKLSIPLIVE